MLLWLVIFSLVHFLSISAPCSPFSASVPPIPKYSLLFPSVYLIFTKGYHKLEITELCYCIFTVTISGNSLKILVTFLCFVTTPIHNSIDTTGGTCLDWLYTLRMKHRVHVFTMHISDWLIIRLQRSCMYGTKCFNP